MLRLEPIAAQEKITSRRHNAQSTLIAQRATIKKLTDHLHQLEREDNGVWSDEEPEPDEEIFTIIWGGPPSKHSNPLDPETPSTSLGADTSSTSYSMRSRRQPPEATMSASTSGASINPSTTAASHSSVDATAKALENDSDLQSDLTQSLLSLAMTLKNSSQAFSAALDADTAALRNATDALDKNTSSMESASKNMGLLKRMSEGKGWWGRMMLYAWIGGLWVVAILLVFVGPKLRL